MRKVAAITQSKIDPFTYTVKKMASLRERDGTLLDNRNMMWRSGLEDGNKQITKIKACRLRGSSS